jgi:ribosomal-protein-alanine N-acetyltransferase
MARPQLQTDRLLLRPFELTDAATVDTLAGDREIAKTTLNIPHPYPEGAAEAWIHRIHESMDNGTSFSLAVVRKADGALLGCSAIHLTPAHRKGELAYWVGRPYWGHGYATEAAGAVMHFGFTELQLNRIFAAYMTDNPASGKVMARLAMQYEGTFRHHVYKDGKPLDIAYCGILRSEYLCK